jgi:hypothetical protein
MGDWCLHPGVALVGQLWGVQHRGVRVYCGERVLDGLAGPVLYYKNTDCVHGCVACDLVLR